MKNSRELSDLVPIVAKKAFEFIRLCKEAGIDVLITSTYRDMESQTALYAQGRTTPGNIVTNAKAGESYHNWHVAFDFVPMKFGKCIWNDIGLFKQCGDIAKTIGLEWAGDWVHFKEYAHCQYTGGLTLQELKSGKTPT